VTSIADPWRVLENPVIWEASRIALDGAFGLYRKRVRVLEDQGALASEASLLDVGCGIGQYADAVSGRYVGIDLNERYIAYARRRRGNARRSFRYADVSVLADEQERFHTVLAVDLLHHLDDAAALTLLDQTARLATDQVAIFEPVQEQRAKIGRWIVDHDRGAHMRTLAHLRQLIDGAPLWVAVDRELMLGPITTRVLLCKPVSRA